MATNYRDTAYAFAEALNEKFPDEIFGVSPGGRKYARITNVLASRYGGSQTVVYAFVDLTNGELLKDAGWVGPAKGARGDLSTPEGFADAVKRADRYGSFLYR